jgi:hypothetical protein
MISEIGADDKKKMEKREWEMEVGVEGAMGDGGG